VNRTIENPNAADSDDRRHYSMNEVIDALAELYGSIVTIRAQFENDFH